MRFHFNRALGDDSSPFAPCKCNADVGAILQGVGGIVGGLSNYWSNYETNVTNKNLARETNKQNYRIWQEQLEAQRQQYLAEKMENRFLVNQAYERNLPKNVVKNMKEAGINPALAFESNAFQNNAVVGQNPSSSVPAAPSMVAPQMVAPDLSAFGQGISNAANYFLAAQKQEADISYLTLKGQNETAETIAKIRNMDKNSRYLNQLADNLEQEFKFNQDTWKQRSFNLEAQGNLMVSQQNLNNASKVVQDEVAHSQKLENAFKECTNPLRAQQMLADLALTAAQKTLMYSQANSIDQLLPYQQSLMKQEFIHLLNEDANAFESLGVSMQYLGLSKGHANMDYMSDWIDPLFKGLGTGAGIWLGLRTFGKSPIKIKGFN